MPRLIGGRTPLGSSVATRPSKLARRQTVVSPCLTESFDKADAPTLGPGLAWDTCCEVAWISGGDYRETNNTEDCLEVYSNEASLTNRADVNTADVILGGSPPTKAVRMQGLARTQSALSTLDVAVSATVTSIPAFVSGEWPLVWFQLSARMDDSTMEIWHYNGVGFGESNGEPTGVYWGLTRDFNVWHQKFRLGAGPYPYTSGPGAELGPGDAAIDDPITLVEGDDLRLTVTGTPGVDFLVVGEINGATVATATVADWEAWWGDATIWDQPQPLGYRAGFWLLSQVDNADDVATTDHLTRINDWQACPA